jgi:hypothetical protein
MTLTSQQLPGHEERWKNSLTLGELVYQMVKEKKWNTPEWRNLVKCFGKQKLKGLYEEEKRKRRMVKSE